MNKYDFLNELKQALEGEVSLNVINENISYYSSYIDSETRKGKGEDEVLQALGEPRLIAKTIIDTSSISNNAKANNSKTYTYSNVNDDINQEETKRKGFNAAYDEQEGLDIRYGNFKLNTWYGKMSLIILFIVVISIIAKITVAILPIVLPVIGIFLLVSYFTGGRR